MRRPGPPTQENIDEMGRFIEGMAKAGILVTTDGLQPSSKGARVKIAAGQFTVTDGPFAEAKELIGGYAIVQVKSKEEANRTGQILSQTHGLRARLRFARCMTPRRFDSQ